MVVHSTLKVPAISDLKMKTGFVYTVGWLSVYVIKVWNILVSMRSTHRWTGLIEWRINVTEIYTGGLPSGAVV